MTGVLRRIWARVSLALVWLRQALARLSVAYLRMFLVQPSGRSSRPARGQQRPSGRSLKVQRFSCPLCGQRVAYMADKALKLTPLQQDEMCVMQWGQHANYR